MGGRRTSCGSTIAGRISSNARCRRRLLIPYIAVRASIVYSEINSDALGRALPIAMIKPAGEEKSRPVLFVLHGRGRHHQTLIDSAARAAMLAAPFVIVLPQGEDGWYIDSPARQLTGR